MFFFCLFFFRLRNDGTEFEVAGHQEYDRAHELKENCSYLYPTCQHSIYDLDFWRDLTHEKSQKSCKKRGNKPRKIFPLACNLIEANALPDLKLWLCTKKQTRGKRWREKKWGKKHPQWTFQTLSKASDQKIAVKSCLTCPTFFILVVCPFAVRCFVTKKNFNKRIKKKPFPIIFSLNDNWNRCKN